MKWPKAYNVCYVEGEANVIIPYMLGLIGLWTVICDRDTHPCVARSATVIPPAPLSRPVACAVEGMATPKPVDCLSFT